MAQGTIGIGMIGCGTVGGGVAKMLREHAALYARRLGRNLELKRVLVRDSAKACNSGLVDPKVVTDDAEAFFETEDMPIVIEVAGGKGPVSDYVRRALGSGRHVVTANKALVAAEGPELFALARDKGVAIAFEASCGGGIPIITAVKFGLMANRVQALYGILNGTCNYILTEMTQSGTGYTHALRDAQELGFAEADPTLDVSGRDAAEKLAILASLAFGVRAHPDMVQTRGIDGLSLADVRYGNELGYQVKLLSIAQAYDSPSDGAARLSLTTEPCFVHQDEPIAAVSGSFNALSVYGSAVGHTMYYGRGAGELPTASAVVSDLLNIAAGWYPHAFAGLNIWPDGNPEPEKVQPDEVTSRYYIRIAARDVPGVMAKVSTILGEAGISLSALLQEEDAEGKFVPVVITTHQATQGALSTALDRIQDLDEIRGRPVCMRIVEMPKG